MTLPNEIVESLREKSSLGLYTSSDCKPLVDAIYAECGQMLGVSTIKRLLGFFQDSRTPHQSTLDIIANYLGANNWDALLMEKCGSDSGFEPTLQHIDTGTLDKDAVLLISYHPNRVLEIRHIEGFEFEVLHYTGTKLRKGDRLTILEIIHQFPMFVKDVVREGKSLGSYIAARKNGVQKVTIS